MWLMRMPPRATPPNVTVGSQNNVSRLPTHALPLLPHAAIMTLRIDLHGLYGIRPPSIETLTGWSGVPRETPVIVTVIGPAIRSSALS